MPAYQRREQHHANSSSTHHHHDPASSPVNDLGNMLDKVNFGSPPITRITVPTPTSPSGIRIGGGTPGASEDTTPEMVRSSRSSASQSQQQQLYNHNNHHLSSFTGSVTHEIVYEFDDDVPEVDDGPGLDDLWSSLRQRKEKKMAREKSKVHSLENRSKPSLANNSQDVPAAEIVPAAASTEDVQQAISSPPLPPPPLPAAATEQASEQPPQSLRPSDMASPPRKKTVQRQKSVTSFRESPDGRTLVASIDMRGTHKDNVHVSFQRTRLVVTWASQEITDWEDENGLWVRERHTKEYQRMFPLPEGTRFDEIASAFSAGGKHLLLRYPNSRAFRVERESDSY